MRTNLIDFGFIHLKATCTLNNHETYMHRIEIDLIVPELADADKVAAVQPWFPLSRPGAPGGTRVQVWPRGERSLVVILPRGAPVVR